MTRPLSVLIADDEPPARRVLRILVEREPDARVAGEAGDGNSTVRLAQDEQPDILFLDVKMPGGDGFDVLRRLGPRAPAAVVFVTAYDRYALRAFEARALDYLLKPFSDERFVDVFDRARQRVREKAGTRRDQLVLRDGGRTIVIPATDIEWIEAEDYCIRVHTESGNPLVRRSLRDVLRDLDPARFLRTHRSAVVNLDQVRQIRPTPAGDRELTLASGAVVRLSRHYRAAFERLFAAGRPPSVRD